MKSPIAVYVHTPFCPTKCGYCDFNSYTLNGSGGLTEDIVERTVRATILEIQRSPWAGRPAKTIFFGGGTPTFLTEEQLTRIFLAVYDAHPPLPNAEITSEANPGTVDMVKFQRMHEAGFNRISLGAQSFLESDLITLGRVHRVGEIERAVGAARDAGFTNINLDLMFGLPGQSVRAWESNLDRALNLDPEHLSLYCLTIEPGTDFYKRQLRGQLDLPGDEDQVEMMERCWARLNAAGFEQYEISNYAKPGRECQHNLEYWTAAEYASYGPGAVGCVDTDSGLRRRYTNLKHPVRYCDAVEEESPVAFEEEFLDEAILRTERIMLGLRLNTGLPFSSLSLSSQAMSKLTDRGWIEVRENRIKLTPAGRHFCSEVALELI